MIDLHIHTDASSDGQHSPSEIFAMAQNKALRAIAFADHNSIANITEGLRLGAEWGIEFIPCLELNTFHKNLDLHLLAYCIDPQDAVLQSWLKEIHRKKQEQAQKRVEKLNELGFVFSWSDLRRFSGERIPTGISFLKAIFSRKENQGDPRLQTYIDGPRSRSPYVNFYHDYLRGGKPAFVQIEDVATDIALRKILALGGIPILAHPADTAEEIILYLIENGLAGLEAYSSYHSRKEQDAYRAFAEKHHLLITAGSDFHGKAVKPDVELGEVSGNHDDLLARLREHCRKR